MNPVSET